MSDPDKLIPVGKIIGTHGIKGHIKLHSYSGNFESIRHARTVFLKSPDGSLAEFRLKSSSPNTGRFIICFQDLDTIDQAELLIGNEVCLKRSSLPDLKNDEYYWNDLIGLHVETDEGVQLGTVVDIFETGSSDIYVVRGETREYLIPAIASVIKLVDLESGRIVITPLDGLLDL